MKKIKPGEYKKPCSFCTNAAKWRANRTPGPMYACDEHREEIVKAERSAAQDSGYMTEADWQTWGRL